MTLQLLIFDQFTFVNKLRSQRSKDRSSIIRVLRKTFIDRSHPVVLLESSEVRSIDKETKRN